jgi:hypothetical protein
MAALHGSLSVENVSLNGRRQPNHVLITTPNFKMYFCNGRLCYLREKTQRNRQIIDTAYTAWDAKIWEVLRYLTTLSKEQILEKVQQNDGWYMETIR